jgi:hypothetical protein
VCFAVDFVSCDPCGWSTSCAICSADLLTTKRVLGMAALTMTMAMWRSGPLQVRRQGLAGSAGVALHIVPVLIACTPCAGDAGFLDDTAGVDTSPILHYQVDSARRAAMLPSATPRRRGRPPGRKNNKTLLREAAAAAAGGGGVLPGANNEAPVPAVATTVAPAVVAAQGGAQARQRPPLPPARPPKAVPAELMQVWEFSVTISAHGDVHKEVFCAFREWCKSTCLAAYAGFEKGPVQGHLHVQAVIRILHKDNRSVAAAIRNALQLSRYGVGFYTVRCKPLSQEGIHTFPGMIGYCSKDHGQPHFDEFAFQVTQEELDLAPLEYATYGGPEQKRKVILRHDTIFSRAEHWQRFFPGPTGVRESFTGTITRMVRSGRFYLDSKFVTPYSGFGMDPVKANALWQVYKDPAGAQSHNISAILYTAPVAHMDRFPRYDGRTTAAYDDYRLAEQAYLDTQHDWDAHDAATGHAAGRKRQPVGVRIVPDSPPHQCSNSHASFIPLPADEPAGKRARGVGKNMTVSQFYAETSSHLSHE